MSTSRTGISLLSASPCVGIHIRAHDENLSITRNASLSKISCGENCRYHLGKAGATMEDRFTGKLDIIFSVLNSASLLTSRHVSLCRFY